MKLRRFKCKGFTIVETLAGIMICSWLFIGCHVLFTGTVNTTNSVFADHNPQNDCIASLMNQIEADISQSIHIFTTPGTLLINGAQFSENQWHNEYGNISPYDVNTIFKGLNTGYRKYGKILRIKKSGTKSSLLVMGNQERILSYYEFTNRSDSSGKSVEVKRFIGQETTHHIYTEQLEQIDLKIDPRSKSLVISHITKQGAQYRNKFPLPYVPV